MSNDDLNIRIVEDPINVVITSGLNGVSPTISVGTVTTKAAGSSATVTQRGTATNVIFDFGIPRGNKGDPGPSVWGGISGNLEDQADLKAALDSKVSLTYSDGYFSIS